MTDAELAQATIANGAPEEGIDRTVDVVLEALGRHVARGAAERLAKELPTLAADSLLRKSDGEPDPIDIPAVVAERLGIDETDALNRVQAVLRAVADGVSAETLDHVRPELPEAMARLLSPTGENPVTSRRAGA
jgi:uncharacterized protein (DUF2267 family)